MANEKKIFGYIDCPTCGFEKGMRITADKHARRSGSVRLTVTVNCV